MNVRVFSHPQLLSISPDRGMVSKDTLEKLESKELGFYYILGVRMRRARSFAEKDFLVDDSFVEVVSRQTKNSSRALLRVSDRIIDGRRYIFCYNEAEAKKDAHDRELIIASLEEKLKGSDKSFVANKGYRKYLREENSHQFFLDKEKIEREARYDGLWVLTTNLELAASEVALKYKELWMVEDAFRSVKSVLKTRPIYHKLDETIRGHVFCSFLSLMLIKELMSRLSQKGLCYEWEDIKQDLLALREVEVEFEGSRYYLRTDLRGSCNEVLKAVGVPIPPSIRTIE
jgi:transposase